MRDSDRFSEGFIGGFIVAGLMMLVVGMLILAWQSENWYKQGQTDALSGNISYCLREQSNFELIWEECEEE